MSGSEGCKALKAERKRLPVSIVKLCTIIESNFEEQCKNVPILNDVLLLGMLLHR